MTSRPGLLTATSSAYVPHENHATHQPSTSVSVRPNTSKRSIYDRNLNRSRTLELSRASFAFLVGEMVSYAQRQVKDITDLEKRYALHPFDSPSHEHPS